MSEDDLLGAVLDLCKVLHLHTAHFRPCRMKDGSWRTPVQGDGAGWPDLVIVGPGGVLYRELKGPHGAVSAAQRAWLDALTAAGQDAGVWAPQDMVSGRIEAELRALRRAAVASC